MPKYTNTSSSTIKVGDFTMLAGETVDLDRYVTDANLTFVSHSTNVLVPPVNLIYDGVIVQNVAITVDLSYPKVNVLNTSGSDVRISFNGISGEEAIRIVDNSYYAFNNSNRSIGAVHFSGEGLGNVSVFNTF